MEWKHEDGTEKEVPTCVSLSPNQKTVLDGMGSPVPSHFPRCKGFQASPSLKYRPLFWASRLTLSGNEFLSPLRAVVPNVEPRRRRQASSREYLKKDVRKSSRKGLSDAPKPVWC